MITGRIGAPAGPREGPSPPVEATGIGACLRAGQLADRRPIAWRTYAGHPPTPRLARRRPASTSGEGPAPRRAHRRPHRIVALSHAAVAPQRERRRTRAFPSRTARRAIRHRARVWLPILERASGARRGEDARLRRRRARVRRGGDRRPVVARRATAFTAPAPRCRDAVLGARRRRHRDGRVASRETSRPGARAWRTPRLAPAPIRLSQLARQLERCEHGWLRRHRAPTHRARRRPEHALPLVASRRKPT